MASAYACEVIDVDRWGPYLSAFTKMQESISTHDVIAANMYRKSMLNYLNKSPEFWRACALREKRRSRLSTIALARENKHCSDRRTKLMELPYD